MPDDIFDDVTTASGFGDSLEQLLRAAVGNGVDVVGAWECDGGGIDYEALISELDRRDD